MLIKDKNYSKYYCVDEMLFLPIDNNTGQQNKSYMNFTYDTWFSMYFCIWNTNSLLDLNQHPSVFSNDIFLEIF